MGHGGRAAGMTRRSSATAVVANSVVSPSPVLEREPFCYYHKLLCRWPCSPALSLETKQQAANAHKPWARNSTLPRPCTLPPACPSAQGAHVFFASQSATQTARGVIVTGMSTFLLSVRSPHGGLGEGEALRAPDDRPDGVARGGSSLASGGVSGALSRSRASGQRWVPLRVPHAHAQQTPELLLCELAEIARRGYRVPRAHIDVHWVAQ